MATSWLLRKIDETYPRVHMSTKISGGVAHALPADLRKALGADPEALTAWEDITPLSRNEWICWTVTVKL